MTRIARGYGAATAGVLAVLGAIHVYWAVRGVSGRSVALPERDGKPLFQPSRAGTLAVAGGLFGGTLMLLGTLGVAWLPLPTNWSRWGAWGLATLFALRAVGDFRYVGLFRRVRGTPFARWDQWLFTPLCVSIALGSALTALVGQGERAERGERLPTRRQRPG